MKLFTPDELLAPLADADLVAQGDEAALQELAARWYRPVCGFLFKKLQQCDLVEDLAQETFLEAFKALREGRPPEHFSSWLFGIAHNRAGKWLRRKKLSLFPANEPPDLAATEFVSVEEELEEQRKTQAALDDGLATLSEETRKLLDMKHRQGMTCEQIARALGQPVGTVKSNLSRTYKALRARMGGAGEVW
jgi:RNA polymerase sigma-70 factor (ECF subfamily)